MLVCLVSCSFSLSQKNQVRKSIRQKITKTKSPQRRGVHFALVNYVRHKSLLWIVVAISSVTTLEKTHFPLPSRQISITNSFIRGGTLSPLHLSLLGFCLILDLCRSYACCYGLRVHLCISPILLKFIFSWSHLTPVAPKTIFLPWDLKEETW